MSQDQDEMATLDRALSILSKVAASDPTITVTPQGSHDPALFCLMCSERSAPDGDDRTLRSLARGDWHAPSCPLLEAKALVEEMRSDTTSQSVHRAVSSILAGYDLTRLADLLVSTLADAGWPVRGWLLVSDESLTCTFLPSSKGLAGYVVSDAFSFGSCLVIDVMTVMEDAFGLSGGAPVQHLGDADRAAS